MSITTINLDRPPSSQEIFMRDFIRKFDPLEPMFIRALQSVYTADFPLEETRRIAAFFSTIGLVPPRLDEWSILLGAAASRILVQNLALQQ